MHTGPGQSRAAAMLYERILAAARSWFGKPVAYFGGRTPMEASEQASAVQDFANALSAAAQTWPSIRLNQGQVCVTESC